MLPEVVDSSSRWITERRVPIRLSAFRVPASIRVATVRRAWTSPTCKTSSNGRTQIATALAGVPATVAWLAEEIGELAQAVRKGTHEQQVHEFGDVIAWVATLANQQGVDLNEAVERFAHGCPKCSAIPCACD